MKPQKPATTAPPNVLYTEADYNRDAEKILAPLEKILKPEEIRIVLGVRLTEVAAAFAANPRGDAWGRLIALMAAMQSLSIEGRRAK